MTKDDVLKKMDVIENESDSILKLFENRRVPQGKVSEAQQLFGALKEKLEAEYKRMATGRGEAALSDVERRFYKPAIDDALTNSGISRIGSNTRPNHHWHDALWGVRDYMRHWGDNLKGAAV
jgi:hypothetical protein